jgi:hypothetical protein
MACHDQSLSGGRHNPGQRINHGRHIASIDVLFRNNAYFTIKPQDFDRIYLIKEAKSIHPKEIEVES